MVTKKTPAKSPSARKIMVETPAVRTRSPSRSKHNPFSYSFVAFLTVLAMLAVEAFFGVPSRWLHGEVILEDSPRNEEVIQICTREYMPVCGKDGKTYSNMCEMENAGADMNYKGECRSPSTDTPAVTPIDEEENAINTPLPETTPSEPNPSEPTQATTLDMTNGWTYTSKVHNYSLTLPRFSYFNVYKTADGKGDVVAVDPVQTKVASTTTAMVRATFTKTGDTPPADANQALTVANGTMSLSYSEPLTKQGKEIVDYIVASAK